MNKFWKDTIYRSAYFLIGAAWLFTLSFIFSNYWSYTSSPQGVRKNLENYLQKKEASFFTIIKDSGLLTRLIHTRESETEMTALTEKEYGIFLYKLEDYGPINLEFWNTQETLPTDEMVVKPDGEYMVDLPNGQYEYIRRKITLPGKENILAIALIPIRWSFYVENDYLRNGFVDHPNVEKNYSISKYASEFAVRNSLGKTLYYLEEKDRGRVYSNDWVTIMLRIFGSLLILFYLHMLAINISRRWGAAWGILLLTTMIVILRTATYFFNVPIDFRQFELFSPSIYGSSIILKSLGDLLLNALLFFWIALFARTQLARVGMTIKTRQKLYRMIIASALVTVLVGLTILCGSIIRSLVSDSQISFDVTNFFSLNLYSIFGFIVLCCVSMGYFISSQVLLQFINSFPESSFFFKAMLTAIIGLVYLTLAINIENGSSFHLGLLIWLLAYMALSSKALIRSSYSISGSSMVYWLVIFSASITLVISVQNRIKEHEKRIRVAEKLAWQADPSSEKLLNLAIGSLNNYFWLNNLEKLKNDIEGANLKDSIINANFSAYLNRFETKLYAFDPLGQPLSGMEGMTYDTLNTIYTMQGRKTNISDLKYYETAFDKFSYIHQRQVKDTSGQTVAYIYMLSNPRRYRSEAMIPELFRQSEEFSFERSPLYAYGLYNNSELISNVNDYPFPSLLTPQETNFNEFKFVSVDGYSELWYKQSSDRLVLITRKSNMLLEAITLFAYLFCAFLFLVALFQTASVIVKSGFRWSTFRDLWQLNIRNQIFMTIIFISIFSFVIIGAATIIFFINRYNRNNQDRLSRTIQVMSNEIQSRINNEDFGIDLGNLRDTANVEKVYKEITELSEIHNVDVNLYNREGRLSISSQPLVYNKGILSPMMNPVAYYNVTTLRKIQHVQYEKTGRLNYLSIYVPIKNEYRRLEAYINIPYFTSSRDLNQEISNFLVTIINLNAFIFLIAGVIAVFLTNRITHSFSWIGEKMREINLGKRNEEITWSRKDEIGGLVKEYNKMVQKLEQSAVDIAKSEREGAWREMARQVAHEIKNPLTPMKLSIQYLQKAIDNNAPNVKELSSGVARTLIEQIDHLSRIASEFSQFANIGNLTNEVFDLHELLYSLASLHSIHENAEVIWEPVEGRVDIFADKTQMNRLFTNLLQNAVEAIPSSRKGLILIREELSKGFVTVIIEDNGTGIPEEMKGKIFSPNFTTKTSGTGLGLAMCMGIVEQAKGEIWFDTNAKKGTSFHVSLPLAEVIIPVEAELQK